MKLKEFNILLDIKNNKSEEFEVVQGDYDTNVLNISIVEGLKPYNLDDVNVEIAFAKPDGTTVLQDIDNGITIMDPIGGKIQCVLKTNTIAAPGRVFAEVRILQGLKLLTTARFSFFVRKAIVNDETIISTNEFPILNQKIEEVNDLIEYVQGMEPIKGDDGKSAYEVWLDAGNEGTVEDFLESLIGPEGPEGKQGVGLDYTWQGTQLGIKREDEIEYSFTDLRGPKGEKGEKGDPGTGINVKGSLNDPSELPSIGELGDAYLINGNLWVWDGETFINAGNIKGPKGDPGSDAEVTKENIEAALGYTPVKSVNNIEADEVGNIELNIDTSEIENRIGNVEDDLAAHKADYAYQTPTIVGTQIRITKQSNTDRLYFRLDNDLIGSSITISLDGGISELPLKDVEGNNVTELEKGFVEVVAEANFFTLRPKGSGGINDTLPPQIENFNVTADDGKVELTWTISDTTYLDGYAFTYKANEIPSNPNDGTKVFADKLSTSLVIDGLTNDVLYYIRAFPYNNKKQYQTEYRVVQSIPRAGIPISDLPIGAKVKFGKYQVETEPKEPITWLIAAKNHIGYPVNSITLITEKIIDLRGFDAKEPSNSDSDRQQYGNNRYRDSNIRQWLNKAGLNWYVKTHTADEPPTDAGISEPTGYDDKEGFLSSFTEDELNIILDTTLTVARNTVTDGGGSETVVDKIFLASSTEVGFENENGIAEGSLLPLFSDDASRIAYVTQQCFNNTKSGNKPSSISNGWHWWLRTPNASNSRNVCSVSPGGSKNNYPAFNGSRGVRPLCNLKSDILVSGTVDSDGCYTILV